MMNDEEQIRQILLSWSENTRRDHRDAILANHAADVVIFDVLPPMKYTSAAQYRASWDEWQPQTTGEVVFKLHDLKITAGSDVGFAYAFIQCGGTTPEGKSFEDWVRATFCLQKVDNCWKITHQHISKPIQK